MKSIYKILFIVISLVMTLGSCSEEKYELGLPNVESVGTFRVSASTISSNASVSRVNVDGIEVKWSDGDEIAIASVGVNGEFLTSGIYKIDANSISEDGKYAEFVGPNLVEGYSYIAYNYPGKGYITDNRADGLNNYFMCDYDYENYDADNIDLVMQSEVFEYDGENTPDLSFEHKSALLYLTISLDANCTWSGKIRAVEIKNSKYNPIFLSSVIFDSNGNYVTDNAAVSTNSISVKKEFELSRETQITIKVPLTWDSSISEIDGEFEFTIITDNSKSNTVTKPLKILENGVSYSADLIFNEPQHNILDDRATLIDIYRATNGDGWKNNTNWCTDADLSTWEGVTTNYDGRVIALSLDSDASGTIPESIGNLTKLKKLTIFSNNITGTIPESIGNLVNLYSLCIKGNGYSLADMSGVGKMNGELPDIFGGMKKLEYLSLGYMQFTGTLPPSIGKLSKLETLILAHNNLEGSIEVLSNLPNLTYLNVRYNNFTGSIPESLVKLPNWNQIVWTHILVQKQGYGFTSIPDIYIEPSNLTTVENVNINTADFFRYNKLTCVVLWCSRYESSRLYMQTIKELYGAYASKGFGLISLNDEQELSDITDYVSYNNIPGHVCQLHSDDYDYKEGTNRIKYMPTTSSPTYVFVDSDGKIVFSERIYPFDDPTMSREQATVAFMEDYFGSPFEPEERYESTDYSKDGEVLTLQKATVGNGINLVIVGDGFVDTDMSSGGEYEDRMMAAMNHFFSEEPYKTFRNRFNVYAVKAVSKNSGVDGVSETIFSCKFGEGTHITGDHSNVFRYATKVPSINSTDDLSVITVLNSYKYAGTCYMYSANGASVSYCPINNSSDEQFRQVITHECGGHGFAKLKDEYVTQGSVITDEAIARFEWQKSLGWGANVDITNDPKTIQWAHFLSDPLYDGQVGIYEGALTYEFGAYRPTDTSIMRYNVGGYNAPSREAIYKTIMKLSGESYSYDKFVKYDAINRTVSANAYRAAAASRVSEAEFKPLGSPVIVKGSPQVSR